MGGYHPGSLRDPPLLQRRGILTHMTYLYNNNQQKDLRQKLRKSLGLPEVIVWNEIKSSKLGKKFRRQYGVGNYVLDFYCSELRLGIELDGSTHDNLETYEKDQNRQEFIQEQGIKVIRFQNKDVLNNLDGVIEEIKKNL